VPWSIVNKGGEKPFCVVKKGEDTPIPGGCHKVRQDAVQHLQALYASESAYAVAESFIEEGPSETTELTYDASTESPWAGFIAFEGVSTGDKRSFAENSITWHDTPLPLLWQKTSSEGHSGSWVIGRVDTIERHDGGKIFATGVLLDTEEANQYKTLLESGSASGVSIDGDTASYQVEETEEKGKPKIKFSSIRVRALTCVSVPAFADAKIQLTGQKPATVEVETEEFCDDIGMTEEAKKLKDKRKKRAMTWTYNNKDADALIAAGAPIRPPSSWFNNQNLPGPTPLTVLDDGQVFGHIGLWGTCHIGMPACTAPPKGGTYAYFHTGALSTEEGEEVSVGHLTFNTGHADVYDNAFNASSHYDHTGAVAADVTAGEDRHGIWVAGAMRPHLTEEEVRIFKAAPISGDWRRIGARLELVAALSVNTPGFHVPRNGTRTKVLVASGQEEAFITLAKQEDFETFGRQAFKQDLAERVSRHTTFDELDFSETWGAVFDTKAGELEGVELEEFYNTCHAPDSGYFCEGPDGPGRVRDNAKKPGRDKTTGVPLKNTTGPGRKRIKSPGYKATGERKKESSGYHPVSDYAYTPDKEDSSGWKLRLTEKPGGKPSAKITAGAAQALSPAGFRGRQVKIPEKERPAVIAKVRTAWLAARPDKTEADLPDVLKKK